MRTRPFYLLTCALAAVAIVVSYASKVNARRAVETAAKAVEPSSPDDREALHSAAHRYASRSDRLSLVGAIVFVLALGGWVFSRLRREHGLQSVPLLLLFLAGLLQLLLV